MTRPKPATTTPVIQLTPRRPDLRRIPHGVSLFLDTHTGLVCLSTAMPPSTTHIHCGHACVELNQVTQTMDVFRGWTVSVFGYLFDPCQPANPCSQPMPRDDDYALDRLAAEYCRCVGCLAQRRKRRSKECPNGTA